MNWQEALRNFHIPKTFHEVSLQHVITQYAGIGSFIQDWVGSEIKPSIYLSGKTGCGKTFTSFALLKALLDSNPNLWTIYIRSHELDTELLRAVEDRQEEYVLEKYQEVPYLFIDDIGTERVNERILRQYYSIIDHRINDLKTTIFTSNIPIEEIEKNLGERIASRLFLVTEIKFPKIDLRKKG